MNQFFANFMGLWRADDKPLLPEPPNAPVQRTKPASPSKRTPSPRRGFARRNDGAQTLTHLR
ncbi:MAG: hypothetical protein ACJ8GW_13745 [Massilia sp.]